MSKDAKVFIGIMGASFLTYEVVTRIWTYYRARCSPLVPIGIVKELFVYPVKSCKGISLFSVYCDKTGPHSGEIFDRHFTVMDGKTGRLYSGREKPQLVTIKVCVSDGVLTAEATDGSSTKVDIEKVRRDHVVKNCKQLYNIKTDGFDCGDEAAKFFAKAIDEPDARLLMYSKELHNDPFVTTNDWWNNNVPRRKDYSAFTNLAPVMITTQASLDDLNSRLDKKVTTGNFRPVIVIDKCPAWDEDRWLDLQIGETKLQCFKPCNRCVLITVDPVTGVKDNNTQPLRKLRE
ncbi:hypothetical protein Q1695_006037 [Nippostrongylus brasiliensis]|nr:hypothetical protein Q1695_006037 [Nippostrongylus brasiliensis]